MLYFAINSTMSTTESWFLKNKTENGISGDKNVPKLDQLLIVRMSSRDRTQCL